MLTDIQTVKHPDTDGRYWKHHPWHMGGSKPPEATENYFAENEILASVDIPNVTFTTEKTQFKALIKSE